jgi:hypothetical protein
VSFVMPYSDGLDSFAVANLVSVGNAAVPLVLVTTGNRRDHAFDKTCAEFRRLAYRVAIPFRLSTRRGRVRHREPSYRSRAFVFGVMAGIAAHLLQAKQIYVAESGQGTFGPWLSPVGNEAADIRMNPLFTRRLSSLLTAILGTEVSHVHPQMWKTKGETLKELRDLNLSDGWWLTWSCSRDQRHISSNHKRIQCGICSGCLLRRQSLNAAGLKSDLDTYLWEDLSAPTLGQSTADHLTVQNDERQAQCAVLDMQLFAGLNSSSSNINAAAQELSSVLNQNADIVESNLRHLISSHAREWEEYRAELGARSFLNRWVDVLK